MPAGLNITLQDLINKQMADDTLKKLKAYLTSESDLDISLGKRIIDNINQYTIRDDNVLVRYLPSDRNKGGTQKSADFKILVPESMTRDVIAAYHDNNLAGHMGIYRTLKRISLLWSWQNMLKDVVTYVACCHTCQVSKAINSAPMGKMKVHQPATQVFEKAYLDLIGPLPSSKSGFKHICVLKDSLSGWLQLYPIRSAKAEKIIECLTHSFLQNGWVRELTVDNASSFHGHVFTQWCKKFHIKLVHTSPYNSKGNLAEISNRSIRCCLRTMVQKHTDWCRFVLPIQFALNSSIQFSSGHSASELNLGRELKTPVDWQFVENSKNWDVKDIHSLADKLRMRIAKATLHARENLIASRTRQAKYYNRKRSAGSFEIGDIVAQKTFYLSDATKGITAKLCPKWSGPYVVIKKTTELNYYLRHLETSQEKAPVHINQLKRYILPRQVNSAKP